MSKSILTLSVAAVFLSGMMVSCEETKEERKGLAVGCCDKILLR